MTARMFVSNLIIVFAVLIIYGSYAETKIALSREEAMKTFAGAYVNTEYAGTFIDMQKFVISSNGEFEHWAFATDEGPTYKGEYTIAASWADSKGNMYCKALIQYYTDTGTGIPHLWMLDKSRNTFEMNYNLGTSEHPTEINPDVEDSPYLYYWTGHRK
jgi:hypothetical protein